MRSLVVGANVSPMLETTLLEPPKAPQPVTQLRLEFIEIQHPGYDDSNTLIRMPAVDGEPRRKGVHYATIHSACAILANNRFDGYLSRSKSGDINGQRVLADPDHIVPAGTYFFHVPGYPCDTQDGKYPVVIAFEHWRFPHGALPGRWEDLNQPELSHFAPSYAQGYCALTGDRTTTQRAHIVPVAQSSWYQTNNMDRYNSRFVTSALKPENDWNNLIFVRSDLHQAWDRNIFALVPKRSSALPGENLTCLVGHMLDNNPSIQRLLHNHPALITATDAAGDHYFARFAQQIISQVAKFFPSDTMRAVVVRTLNLDLFTVQYFHRG